MVTVHGPRSPASKIMEWDAVCAWRETVRGAVVFTNGVFDLLHRGHIDVLNEARREGGALIVGINSDASVRRLKGESRPICAALERAYVVAALEAELVQMVQPDVIVKGGDYAPDTVVGADVVRARNGRVVIVPIVPGHSTTSTIEKLRAL
jgi:rfaE bifunctional protein nucleotidyltransferase chain/domain